MDLQPSQGPQIDRDGASAHLRRLKLSQRLARFVTNGKPQSSCPFNEEEADAASSIGTPDTVDYPPTK